MQIYKNIEKICKDRNISIAKLERDLGIANGTLRRWGVTSPGIKSVVDVADYLEVSIDELCGRESKNEELEMAIQFQAEQNKLSKEENAFLMMLRTMTDEQKKDWLYEGMKIKYGNETR